MNKIPVSQTIVSAYRFTFTHLGTIIGLIWIPMVIATALYFFAMSAYLDNFSAAMAQNNPAMAGQSVLLVFFGSLVWLALYAMIYVAVTRQALGLRTGTAVAHFEIGQPVWRMFGGMLAVFLIVGIFYGLLLLAALMTLATVGNGGAAASPGLTLGLGVFLIVGACALLFVTLRLGFLLAPVIVAEERLSIARGWELTKGNFWRIVIILIATLGPVLLLVSVAEAVILGPDYFTAGLNVAPSLSDEAAHMREFSAHLPVLTGLSFLISPFMTGLALGAAATAYRALVPART